MPAPRQVKRLLPVVLAALVGLLAITGRAGAQTPSAPVITTVTAGDGSLAVAWTAPNNQGRPNITSYDLRHIETDDDETVDANWTVLTGIWTSGALEYTVTGLDGDISYDVQVRAVNSEGDGDWSSTSMRTPGVGAPTIDSVILGDGVLTVSWSEPPHAAKATITSYDLRYIATSADETLDSNWTTETEIWTRGSRIYVLDGLTNGTGYDVQVRAVTSSAASWSATAVGTPAEHGDTLADATDVTPGARVGGSIDPGTDADYFKVVLTRPTGLLVFTDGDLDTVGELLKSDGTVIEENDDGYASHGIRNFVLWDSLTAGTYYIKVTSYDEATGSYVLVTRPIADSTSRSSAQTISLGGSRTGIIDPLGDQDWFTFTLTEQTKVIVRGSSLIEGEILDSNGNSIDNFEEVDLPASGFVHLADLAPGRYYVEVKPAEVFLRGLYSLYVLEAADPGSTRADAVPLDLYRVAAGTIYPTTDADYFRIELDEAIHARLRAIGADVQGPDVDITGELLDSNGNTVSSAVVYETSFDSDDPLGFVLLHELTAGTHYLKVTRNTSGSGSATGPYAVLLTEDVLYADLVAQCEGITLSNSNANASDPLYGCQWHLHNEGQRKGAGGEDINVEDAWTTTRGSGVNVAVVDDGMQHSHPDLTANVAPCPGPQCRNHDYTGGGDIYNPAESHGTRVAGIIAARDNSIGMRGVAPQATIYGHNYLVKPSDVNEANAMTHNMEVTAVSNNSWGPGENPLPNPASDLWERAVDSGVSDGLGGEGVFYVFAAGNGADEGDYGTLDEYANYYAVTAACAVNDLGERTSYSEMGANLWVCAPSSDFARGRTGIATTNNFGRYTTSFGGTSAAAPQVSGVAALVRAVGSSLSWRDVKLILAASARKNDRDNTGWLTGALKYGSTTERYEFNHEYGFGVVDAEAAVDLAGSWSKVPPMRKTGPVENTSGVTVPTNRTTVSRSIRVDSDIDFIEFVQVDATFDADEFRDLQVELVSPSRKVSVLSVPESANCPYRRYSFSDPDPCDLDGSFRFGSARHLGEDPSGTWTLRMTDRLSGVRTNRLESWSITVYGHKSTPDAPDLTYVDPGPEILTVAWARPTYRGSSAITGYDVRYIHSDSSNKANDSAWTVIGAGGTGTRQYTIPGLIDGRRRDVQVRAVNASGGGDWSVTARGMPGATNSEPFFAEGLEATRTVREDAGAGQSIGMTFTAKEADSDTLTFTLGGRDAALLDVVSTTGQLQVKNPLDYETEDSHEVTVSVRDSKDAAGNDDTATDATINVTVVVDDVDEPRR